VVCISLERISNGHLNDFCKIESFERGVLLFLTLERAIKKIEQERSRGELKKAMERALDALKKWPDSFELASIAVNCCIDSGDSAQATSILKGMLRQHPSKKKAILELADSAYRTTFNPIIGSFLIELLIRSKDIESVEEILRRSSDEFISDLIRRSETRAEGLKQQGSAQAIFENNILLALLYIESQKEENAIPPLLEVLKSPSVDLEMAGNLLIKIEQAHPGNPLVKYALGLVSIKLNRPRKALPRLFQSLKHEDAPVEEILEAVEAINDDIPELKLLKGELLILKQRIQEGCNLIRDYIKNLISPIEPQGLMEEGEPPREEKINFAISRVSGLLSKFPESKEIALLYADMKKTSGEIKEGIAALEVLYNLNPESSEEIVNWLEMDDEVLICAPAKKLLAKIYIAEKKLRDAIRSARMAIDMDPSTVPELIKTVEETMEGLDEPDPLFYYFLALLASKAKDKERAEELLSKLIEEEALEKDELFELARDIMTNCGISVNGASSAIEACFSFGKPMDALPHLISLYREAPEEHESIATSLRELANEKEEYWQYISQLIEALSKEEQLSPPMKYLLAESHLMTGQVERAIFEFDQLTMMNEDIKFKLVELYGKAAQKYSENATLQLALYHLNLDMELYSDAAHYLCRTLELDPGQIKDIVLRFEKLTALDPTNHLIWEEMLKTALNLKHTSLASDILKKALEKLPEEDSSALHIYGAKIYSLSGKLEESLRCLAVSLSSPKADLISIKDELLKLRSIAPSNPEVHFLLGETLLKLDDEEGSIESYRACIKLSPAYIDHVTEKLKELLPLSSKPYTISKLLGEIYISSGKKDEGIQYLIEAQKGPEEHIKNLTPLLSKLSTENSDETFSLLYARNLALEGKLNESVEVLEKLHSKGTNNLQWITQILNEIIQRNRNHAGANRLLTKIYLDSGQTSSALASVVAMLEDSEQSPDTLVSLAEEFFDVFKENTTFIIPLAHLEAKRNERKVALQLFREALRINQQEWEKIFDHLSQIQWDKETENEAKLLKIDCLLAGNSTSRAVDEVCSTKWEIFDDISPVIERIKKLMESTTERKLFSFTCKLLAERGMLEEVLSIAEKGFHSLSGQELTDFRIEIAETLSRKGYHEESRKILEEVLNQAENKWEIYRLIESNFRSFTDSELERAIEKAKENTLSKEEAHEAIELALEASRIEEALALIERAQLNENEKLYLRARTYLSEDKPFDCLILLSSVDKQQIENPELAKELLYMEGIAGEMVSDFGRAYTSFSTIISKFGDFRDARSRANKNYTQFIEGASGIKILTKCGTL